MTPTPKTLEDRAPGRTRADSRRVLAAAHRLSLCVDPEALVRAAGDALEELFGADLVLVLQLGPETADLVPAYSVGFDPEVLAGVGFSIRGQLAGWLLVKEQCVALSEKMGLWERLEPREREQLRRLAVRLCVPLVALNRLIGMVLLGSKDPAWKLESEEIELLQMLAQQAALALENALLHSQQRDRLRRLYRAERLATAGRLAAEIVHEIRNPLTVIGSTVQYLHAGFSPDDPRRELADGVLKDVARIERTLGGLLELGRPRAAQRVEIDLARALDEALLLIEGQAQQRGVAVERAYDREGLRVRVDPDEIKQVFLNLFLNALQAMPEGGTLRVAARSRPAGTGETGGRTVRVTVADTGCGISPEDQPKVFDPFYTTKERGSGLGLAICQSILAQHDGEIDLQSTVGKGTTVSVFLPLVD